MSLLCLYHQVLKVQCTIFSFIWRIKYTCLKRCPVCSVWFLLAYSLNIGCPNIITFFGHHIFTQSSSSNYLEQNNYSLGKRIFALIDHFSLFCSRHSFVFFLFFSIPSTDAFLTLFSFLTIILSSNFSYFYLILKGRPRRAREIDSREEKGKKNGIDRVSIR